MKLWLESLDLLDCLQPEKSQFGIAASSHEKVMGLDNTRRNKILNTTTTRKMIWPDYGTKCNSGPRFAPSEVLLARFQNASEECTVNFWEEETNNSSPGLIEVSCNFTDTHQEYDVRFRPFAVQWNPSTVIAVQRFLGRLRKESKTIAVQVFHQKIDDMLSGAKNEEAMKTSLETPSAKPEVRAKIHIDSLTVCLNKEHQYRRLLELTFSTCEVQMISSDHGMLIDAKLADLAAFDMDGCFQDADEESFVSKENRKVLSVLAERNTVENGQFIHFVYKTFTDHAKYVSTTDVPDWVLSHVESRNDIDDFLSVTMASTRFTYLKERTEELLDYLSNGLPGKGMGATSRAAKGFISRRIQTKSFLQVQINSPQIYIPQHAMAKQGLALKIGTYSFYVAYKVTHLSSINAHQYLLIYFLLSTGDVAVKSWFEHLKTIDVVPCRQHKTNTYFQRKALFRPLRAAECRSVES